MAAADFRNSLFYEFWNDCQRPFEALLAEGRLTKRAISWEEKPLVVWRWVCKQDQTNTRQLQAQSILKSIAQREGTESIKHQWWIHETEPCMDDGRTCWFLRSSHSKVACEKLELEPQDPTADLRWHWRTRMRRISMHPVLPLWLQSPHWLRELSAPQSPQS